MSYRYKQMILDPRAEGPSYDDQWSAYVLITEMGGAEAVVTIFHISGRFRTRQLALGTALVLAKKKVDELRNSADIQEIFKQADTLPSTAHVAFGRGNRTDDVAIGSDGQATMVYGPGNPEDRFGSA